MLRLAASIAHCGVDHKKHYEIGEEAESEQEKWLFFWTMMLSSARSTEHTFQWNRERHFVSQFTRVILFIFIF